MIPNRIALEVYIVWHEGLDFVTNVLILHEKKVLTMERVWFRNSVGSASTLEGRSPFLIRRPSFF